MAGEKQPRRVLVAGATGYLGGEVVKVLHAAGHRVRALARDPKRLGELRDLCDDVFVAEVTEPDTLIGICDGMDAVFTSVGVRTMKRKPTFWDVDCQGNLNLLEQAQNAQVDDFIFVSVFQGDQMRDRVPQAEARERVVDALPTSGLRWAVVRPSGFFNDMQEFFEMARSGRVWLVGDGRVRLNPIHGADIATKVLELLEQPYESGHAVDLGGPDVLTMRELGELAFRVLQKPAKFGRIPVGVLRTAAAMLKPFNQNVSALISMFAAFGQTEDTVAPSWGDHHLEDFYRELARKAGT